MRGLNCIHALFLQKFLIWEYLNTFLLKGIFYKDIRVVFKLVHYRIKAKVPASISDSIFILLRRISIAVNSK